MKLNYFFLTAVFFSHSTLAQTVAVSDGWVRATVQGQRATGAFMRLTAKESAKLVAGSSSAAGIVEIHEMKMDNDVMKMTPLTNGLDLPIGKTVELKPGGYHIMLMDLKAPLAVNSNVSVTLTFQDAKGKKFSQELNLPVRALTSAGEHKH